VHRRQLARAKDLAELGRHQLLRAGAARQRRGRALPGAGAGGDGAAARRRPAAAAAPGGGAAEADLHVARIRRRRRLSKLGGDCRRGAGAGAGRVRRGRGGRGAKRAPPRAVQPRAQPRGQLGDKAGVEQVQQGTLRQARHILHQHGACRGGGGRGRGVVVAGAGAAVVRAGRQVGDAQADGPARVCVWRRIHRVR